MIPFNLRKWTKEFEEKIYRNLNLKNSYRSCIETNVIWFKRIWMLDDSLFNSPWSITVHIRSIENEGYTCNLVHILVLTLQECGRPEDALINNQSSPELLEGEIDFKLVIICLTVFFNE